MQPAPAPLYQNETPPVFPHAKESDEIDYCSIDHGPIDYESIVTEDDTPVENLLSERNRTLLTAPLNDFWRPGRPFLAMSDVGLFYLPKAPPLVPDAMLSLDVSVPAPPENLKKEYRSYFLWKYKKPPEVVIEIVSNKEGGEKDRKFEKYAQIKVKYYAVYDPYHYILADDPLEVYELKRGQYAHMQAPYFLPDVGLGLTLWEGTYGVYLATYLRWCNLDGGLLPTGEERANEAERELERLERILRGAGIDPDMLG